MLPCQACSRPYNESYKQECGYDFLSMSALRGKEYEDSTNHYNCPMVTSYPEVIKNNMIS